MKRHNLILTSVVLSLALSSSDMYGQRTKNPTPTRDGILGFVVGSCEGQVITRAPLGVSWRQTQKGKFIPDFDLVQVAKNGQVELFRAEINPETNVITRISGDNTGVKIDTPAIIRTGPKLLRHIELSKYFVEEMPKISERLLDQNPDWFLDEAWKRVAAIFSGRATINNESSQGKNDKSTAQSTGGLGKISLLSPASGAYLERDRFPTDINVAWTTDPKTSNADTKYKIYLWPIGESRKDPVAYTSGDSYRLSVDKAGEYMVQVEREDGTAVSTPRKIYIADRRTDKIAKISGKKQLEFDTKLSTPAIGESIVSKKDAPPVFFLAPVFPLRRTPCTGR